MKNNLFNDEHSYGYSDWYCEEYRDLMEYIAIEDEVNDDDCQRTLSDFSDEEFMTCTCRNEGFCMLNNCKMVRISEGVYASEEEHEQAVEREELIKAELHKEKSEEDCPNCSHRSYCTEPCFDLLQVDTKSEEDCIRRGFEEVCERKSDENCKSCIMQGWVCPDADPCLYAPGSCITCDKREGCSNE